MASRLNVRAAVLCEDIRTEANGKHILIGVFGPDINVQHFPITLRLVILPMLDVEKGDGLSIKLRILGPAGDPIGEFEVGMDAMQDLEGVFLPPIGLQTPFSAPGSLRLEFRDGDAWRHVQTWQVQRGEPPIPVPVQK